jgi:preprotein translocase subunit SecG
MTLILFASSFVHAVLCTLLFITAVFLILLVLVQRGRGGGLTGALGGMGGQSAFGTKAGDMFTRVTMITAGIWIVLCMATIKLLSSQNPWGASTKVRQQTSAPATPGKEADSEDGGETKSTGAAGTGDTTGPAPQDAASPAGAAEKTGAESAPSADPAAPAAPKKD